MQRAVGWLVLLPLGLVLVLFALANRDVVEIGFDPLTPDIPFVAPVQMPTFVLIYAVLMAGVLIGGIASWFAQARHRAEERHLRRRAEALEAELERLRRERRSDDTLALLEDGESG